MNDIRIVFFDIDGTLVSFDTHAIPQTTLDAVSVLRKQGIKVYIATGRPLSFIDNLGCMEYDGMITATGAYCFAADGHEIFHCPLSEDTVERVIHHNETSKEAYPVMFVSERELFMSDTNEEVEAIVKLLDLQVPEVRPAADARGKNIIQLISFFHQEEEKKYMQELMPDGVSMRWHPFFTDVISNKVSKKVGIDKVLAYEGIELAHAMAFGDGGNDLSMITHVPYGVAMGNACDALKAVACHVTDTVDNDGIVKALRHFGLLPS